jgi:Restriction endonuclease
MLTEASGAIGLGPVARQWLDGRDPAPVIALIHSRVRFVGELLAEIFEPKTDSEILEIANRYYDTRWETKAQIRRRRGWLESAGMLGEATDGALVATVAGRELVDRLQLQPRADAPAPRPVVTPSPVVEDTFPAETRALIARLKEAANDGSDPDRFEQETAEVFRRLGFQSQWLGGAGKTDVLLEADLGRDASYRVVVDCKSTSRGSVSQQIDWDTIDEHRAQHHADHAAIVAPAFGGGRLPERAERHEAIMLTVDDLAELLVQQAKTPLGLDTYRQLFMSGTTEDGMAAVGEAAQEIERRIDLMGSALGLLHQFGNQMGPLSARDLALLLIAAGDQPDATQEEIAEIIDALSSPLFGALAHTTEDHVRPTGSTAAFAQVLRALADRIDPQPPETPDAPA